MRFVVIATRWAGVSTHDVFGPFDSEPEAFRWLHDNRPKNATTLVRPLKEVA